MIPSVSIIVCNWNGKDVLRDCLRSIVTQTHDVTFETILVDDASTDGSAEMVSAEFPDVRLVRRVVNGGFVRANNEGINHARGAYCFLLNSDTLLINNAVAILAAYLGAHPHVGICGGWLFSTDGSSQVSYGSAPSLRQAMTDAFFLNDLFPSAGFPNRGVVPRVTMMAPVAVEYVTGADLMIRTELIHRFGLFDERYEAYCEEVDLCRRVHTQGHMEVHFVPEARIVHRGGFSYGKQGERHVRTQYASYHSYLTKHYGRVYSLAVRLLYAWHYAVKFIVRALRWASAQQKEKAGLRQAMRTAQSIIRYSLWPPRGSGRI
jgi:GT2 family glycosyltransferase